MLAADVLRLVSGALQDLEPGTEKRWEWTGGDDERVGLLDFLNAAVRAVALLRPDATARTAKLRLVPGVRQNIPKDALTLIELLRNLDEGSGRPGTGIQIMPVDVLTNMAAYMPPASMIQNYAYDRATNPKVFWVLPAVGEEYDVCVEATYSAAPMEIQSPEDALPVADTYSQAIVHHMLASILGGDNESSNAGKAQFHVQMFQSLMGGKTQVDVQWPKTWARGTA